MHLQCLSAVNALNYNTLSVNFNSGVTLINGQNKKGKSSILDILRYSIYGNCRKSKKISYFRKRGCKEDTSTTITFDFEGGAWAVHRTISGKKNETNAFITIDGIEKAKGSSEVEAFINENFVSEELFCNSNLSGQMDASALLHAKAAERFKMFKKIFDLEEYQKKAKLVGEDRIKLNSELNELEGTKSSLSKDIESHMACLINPEEITSLLQKEELIVSDNTRKIRDIDGEVAQVDAQINSIGSKNALIIQANSNYDTISSQITKLKAEIEGIDADSTKLEQSISQSNSETSRLKEEVSKNEDLKSKQVVKRVKSFDDTQLYQIQKAITNIEAAVVALKKDEQFVMAGVCPTCGGEVKACHGKEVSTIREEIALLEAQGKENEENQKNLLAQKEEIALAQKENDATKTEKLRLEGVINLLNEKIQSEADKICFSQLRLDKIRLRRSDASQSLSEMEVSFKGMSKQPLESVDSWTSKKTLLVQSKEPFQTILTASTSEVSRLKDLLLKNEMYLKLISDAQAKLKETSSLVEKKQEAVADLDDVKEIIEKKLPLYMIVSKLKIISQECNKFLHKIDSQYTISFDASSKDSLDILIKDNNTGDESPAENLSGFEETLIGLSIRVGISHYNNYLNKKHIGWFAVDEPDKSADEFSAEKLFTTLRELGGEFSQMLIVTHKMFIKESFYGATVLNVDRNEETSFIEVAS